jgi:hypothetical protein
MWVSDDKELVPFVDIEFFSQFHGQGDLSSLADRGAPIKYGFFHHRQALGGRQALYPIYTFSYKSYKSYFNDFLQ